jgi:glycosyltransferase involved in cell wall biosynthesis
MHVLMVNNLYPPIMAGGAELIVAWLGEALVRRGHRVTAVSTCGPEMEPHPVEHRNGVEVIRFFPRNLYWSFARDGQPTAHRLLWHLRDAWNLDAGRRLRAIIASCQPDIVHTHVIDGFSATVWRRAHAAGVPVLHTAHDYHLLCPRAFLLTRDWLICRNPSVFCRAYRAWHLHTTTDVDLFISPSQFLLDLHRGAGMVPRQTAVVRNGIPLPTIPLQSREPGPLKLLLLCRLTEEKGIRVVLHAVARLPHDLAFSLTIAGRGPLEPVVRQAAAADPRITFLGFVQGDAKHELLLSADHLLIPSLWYENAPVAVIEAAAYRLGLIGSRIGGIPELVAEGQSGWLFEPGNAAALADIIGGLVAGSLHLRDLEQTAAAIAERHSVDRMVDAYLAHYLALTTSRSAPLAA